MIEGLYTKYFQKSKSFLFPVLGIKKTSKYLPNATYLAIENLFDASDMKLVCEYTQLEEDPYKKFELEQLLSNPLFEKAITLKDKKLYIFNFSIYENDWSSFLLGKYSKLSNIIKRAIKAYYGDLSTEYKYMDMFLYPENYYKKYAELLNIDEVLLHEVKELCPCCDLELETIKIPVEELEMLNKTT